MKKIAALVCVSLLFNASLFRPVQAQNLEVNWLIGPMDNDSLKDLSFKLLQAISKNKIKAYHAESNQIISKKDLQKKLEPLVDTQNMLTKEEIAIMLHCGDYSFMEYIETKYSVVELMELAEKYSLKDFVERVVNAEKIEIIFELKKIKPFETDRLLFEINEKISLDTTLRIQKGNIEYLHLIIPHYFTTSQQNERLCSISYQDFQKLNLPKEKKIIKERNFVINTFDADIFILDQNKTVFRLSDLRTTDGKMVDEHRVNASIFKYFRGSILIFDPVYRR